VIVSYSRRDVTRVDRLVNCSEYKICVYCENYPLLFSLAVQMYNNTFQVREHCLFVCFLLDHATLCACVPHARSLLGARTSMNHRMCACVCPSRNQLLSRTSTFAGLKGQFLYEVQ